MDFLGDANTASALDVIFFVREIMETNAKLRQSILARLRDTFYHIWCVFWGGGGGTCMQVRAGGVPA